MAETPAMPLFKHLYFQDGVSDKFYTVVLRESIEQPGKYLVEGHYGRIGQKANVCRKTPMPVSYYGACVVFDQVIHEKIKKGYKEAPKPAAPEPAKSKVEETLAKLLQENESFMAMKTVKLSLAAIKPPKKFPEEEFFGMETGRRIKELD